MRRDLAYLPQHRAQLYEADDVNPHSKTAIATENDIELREMRDDRDASTAIAQEAEHLLGEAQSNTHANHIPADSIDESILGSPGCFIWGLTFSAGVSGLLFGYDTGVISSTLVSIGADLSNRQLTTLDKSLITSATSLFALLASPVAGIIADALGRKKVILLADILFIVGAIWQALTSDVVNMIVGRAIVGAAVGIASFVTPMYISELAPSPFRGRLVTIQSLLITGGQVVAYVVGWAFSTTSHGWRSMVGIGAVPALVQLLSVIFLPETPRWLVKAGQSQRALAVLLRAYGGNTTRGPSRRQKELLAEHTLQNIEREIQLEEESRSAQVTPDSRKAGFSASLDRVTHVFGELLGVGSNRRALVIACMLQAGQQLCGFNSLMYFSATIFALVGFRSPTLTALSIATTNFLFTLVAFYSIDRVGRRHILLYSVPFMVFGLALCAFAFLYVELPLGDSLRNVDRPAASGIWPTIILISMVLYVASYATGLGNVPWQQSELFPLSVRSLGSSLATGTNWFSNTIVGLTFLPMLGLLTPTGTFTLYALVCVVTWITIWSIYPETAGLELEDVSELLRDDWGVGKSVRLFAARRDHDKSQREPVRQD